MEPNLKDMDDYTQPLSDAKLKTIAVAFLTTLMVFAAFAYGINALG